MEKAERSEFAVIVGTDQKTAFSDQVQMCIKCCKKLDQDGKPLRKSVKAAIKNAYREAVELEKVGCFSLCPKGGQVLATNGIDGRRLVIIQPGSNVERALDYLLRA